MRTTAHRYRSSFTSATLSTARGYPAVGGSAVTAGTLHVTPGGDGALVDRIAITAQSADNAFAFRGSEVDFQAPGKVRNAFIGTATIAADGSTQLAGHGAFRGGTGAYRGAIGTYAFHAAIAAGASLLEGGSTGTLTY
jgi:hypothetical protein